MPKQTLSYYIVETYPILIHGRKTLLGPRRESAAIAYINTWGHSHLTPPHTWSAHTHTTSLKSTINRSLIFLNYLQDAINQSMVSQFVFLLEDVLDKVQQKVEGQFFRLTKGNSHPILDNVTKILSNSVWGCCTIGLKLLQLRKINQLNKKVEGEKW